MQSVRHNLARLPRTTVLRSTMQRSAIRVFSSNIRPNAPVTPAGVALERKLANSLKQDVGLRGNNGIVATVFGATGFLGGYVVNILGRVGSQCIVPYRGDGQNARPLKVNGDVGQVVPLPYDLKDEASIRRAVKRSNVVINLIGNRDETNNFDFHATNVKIPYRLAKIAREEGVERFIHVSAMGASPDSPSEFLRTKYEGEQVVRDLFPDATIVRPCTMFGREDRFLTRYAEFAFYSQLVPLFEDGSSKVQPVHVHDVANAIFNSITYSGAVGKNIDVAGPDVFTQRQLVEVINEAILPAYKRYVVPTPAFALKLLAKVLKGLPQKFRIYSVDEVDILTHDLVQTRGDANTLQLDDLGIKPQSLNQNLWDCIAVYAHGAGRAPSHAGHQDQNYEKA